MTRSRPATAARSGGTSRRAARQSRLWAAACLSALALAATLNGGGIYTALPALYLIAGGVSAVLYARDKAAAIAGEWRVSEQTLHGVDFFGGIIGGLLAQHYFRHKTAKPDFAFATWLIAALHAGALLVLASRLVIHAA